MVASDGETIVSAEAWALLNGRAEGAQTSDGCWHVTSIREEDMLSSEDLGSISSGEKILEAWSRRSKLLIDEIKQKCESIACVHGQH